MSTKMATGSASGQNAQQTAAAAVAQAQAQLKGAPVHLAIVYVSSEYDYAEVVRTVRKATAGATLIGSSTAGEFTEHSVGKGTVVCALLSSDTMQFHIASATGVRANVEKAVQTVAQALPTTVQDFPHLGVMLLVDGLAGVGEEITLMASNFFPDVPVFGGTASDDFKMQKAVVFHDDQVLEDGVVCCLMASKAPFYVAVNHGHSPLCDAMKITKAKGNVLYEVDGRPAWDVWKEKTRSAAAKRGINTSELTLAPDIGKFLANYELGLRQDEQHYKVRYPSGVNADGSINFTCGIAEGSVFTIMDGSKLDDLIEAAGQAARNAKQKALQEGHEKIAAVLIFECAVRAMMLDDKFGLGVDRFKQELGNVPLIGFETYGEICLEPGEFSGYHNTTSVVVLIADH